MWRNVLYKTLRPSYIGLEVLQLDLSQAYQQVLLYKESTKYATINRHRYLISRLVCLVEFCPLLQHSKRKGVSSSKESPM